jgi:hypothetical protein
VAITLSVFGSKTRACGGANMDGQTERMRPALSNASDPHSDGACAPVFVCRLRPSGPERW